MQFSSILKTRLFTLVTACMALAGCAANSTPSEDPDPPLDRPFALSIPGTSNEGAAGEYVTLWDWKSSTTRLITFVGVPARDLTPRPVFSSKTNQYYFTSRSLQKLGILDPASGTVEYIDLVSPQALQKSSTTTGFLVLESTLPRGDKSDLSLAIFDTAKKQVTASAVVPHANTSNHDFVVDSSDQFWFTAKTGENQTLYKLNPTTGTAKVALSGAEDQGMFVVGITDRHVVLSQYALGAFPQGDTPTRNELILVDVETNAVSARIVSSSRPRTIVTNSFSFNKKLHLVFSQISGEKVINSLYELDESLGALHDTGRSIDFWATGDWLVREDTVFLLNAMSGDVLHGVRYQMNTPGPGQSEGLVISAELKKGEK